MKKYFGSIGWDFPKDEEQLANFNSVFADYEFECDENKIDPIKILEKIKSPIVKITNVDFHKRTTLAAEIVSQLKNENTLGHIKLHKLLFLCQHTTNMNLHTNFLKQAMGPYDPQMMRSIDSQFKKRKWFIYLKDEFPKYKPLENEGEHKEWYEKYFSEQVIEINQLINLFRTATSKQVELVATIYSCWLEAIEKKEIISDNLLIQKFYAWSPNKKDFAKKQIISAIVWMKEKGISPSR